jgi:hypothetical protein
LFNFLKYSLLLILIKYTWDKDWGKDWGEGWGEVWGEDWIGGIFSITSNVATSQLAVNPIVFKFV